MAQLTDEQLNYIAQKKNIEGEAFQKEKEIDDRWKERLETNDRGKVLSNAYNTLLIFKNDENLKGKFAFNLLAHRVEIVGNVPWKRITGHTEIDDHDDSCLRNYFSIEYGIRAKDIIFDVLNEIVLDNQFHPIRNYLGGLEWDGTSRLDTLLVDFFDADDTDLNRWQTRLTFIGAVARVFGPGCKFDYVLTLKGPQGVGKSSFIQIIAIKDEWFSDSLTDMQGKDAKEQLMGKWIIELGEMAAVSKGDQKKIKQFITSRIDEFRHAYGRRSIRSPRQCIFVATTNDELPLKDDTGGRRWWIVDIKEKWFEKELKLNREYVEQIWAEAVYQYQYMERNGIALKLPNNLEEIAKKVQNENTDKGLFSSEIEYVLQRGYIEKKVYVNDQIQIKKIPIDETCAFHVWEEVLGRHRNDLNRATAREINATLKNIEGWEQVGRIQFGDYGKQTVYKKIEN